MNKFIKTLKSQQGMYAIVLVSVISFVFLVVSLNLSKSITAYTHFETAGKERLLRWRALREIQELLYNTSACNSSFNNGSSMETQTVYNKNGDPVFNLSKDSYEDRGFKEVGLPKARKLTILPCKTESFEEGKDSKACLPPSSIKDQSNHYHSAVTLKVDFQKYFLKDEKNPNSRENFYPLYIPIYLKTQQSPASKPTAFKTCSTFTPLLSNFYCSPMKFEFTCCRYVYNMELLPNKTNPKIYKDVFPAGPQIYKQTKYPGGQVRIIPTAEDPRGTKGSAIQECRSSAKKAFMLAVCTFSEGWKIQTKCLK